MGKVRKLEPREPVREAILVTGAAGFIASHLIEALLSRGQSVIGVDNFDPYYDRALKEQNLERLRGRAKESGAHFNFHELDIRELTPKDLAAAKITSVIHLAAKAGVRPSIQEPEAYLLTNVLGTLRVLEFARHRKVQTLIFGSSSSVYGDDTPVPFRESAQADRPISPYAASKRACELYCANYSHLYGLTIASLRFFTVYGPRQRPDLAIHKFARQIRDGETIVLYGDGQTERDYTYVTDTVTGILGALDWAARQEPGTYDVFNLGGSGTTSLKKLVDLLEKNLGSKARIEWAPMQPGDVLKTSAEISRSTQTLGYAPKVPIEDGIRLFSEWFRTQKAPRKKKAA